MTKVRVHCLVSGMVQGVSFRAFTVEVAEKLGVTGWVKNLPDGRVETVTEGEEEDVEKFLKIVRKGPLFSEVRDLEVRREKYIGEFTEFRISW